MADVVLDDVAAAAATWRGVICPNGAHGSGISAMSQEGLGADERPATPGTLMRTLVAARTAAMSDAPTPAEVNATKTLQKSILA